MYFLVSIAFLVIGLIKGNTDFLIISGIFAIATEVSRIAYKMKS